MGILGILGTALDRIRAFDRWLHRIFLYRAKRFLTLERVTALVMCLYALPLLFNTLPSVNALGRALHFPALSVLYGAITTVSLVFLLSGELDERGYHLAIQPMLVYPAMVIWYLLSQQSQSIMISSPTWGTVLIGFVIWALFFIAGVRLPAEGSRDARSQRS